MQVGRNHIFFNGAKHTSEELPIDLWKSAFKYRIVLIKHKDEKGLQWHLVWRVTKYALKGLTKMLGCLSWSGFVVAL